MTEILDRSEHNGLVITGVYRDSPAYLAGLKPGDVMLEINEEKVIDGITSMHNIAQTKPGKTVAIRFLRNNQEHSTEVVIGIRPKQK